MAVGSAARQRPTQAVVLFGVCLLGLSAVRFAQQTYEFGPNNLAQIIEPRGKYRVFGRVADWPEFRTAYTNFAIDVDSLQGDESRAVQGRLLLRVSDTTTALQRGDYVEFVGRVYPVTNRPGVGRFDYSRYLNLKGVTATVYAATLLDVRIDRANRYTVFALVDRLRDSILGSFERNLSPTARALAAGFLIGETRNIPPDIYDHFRDSGTLHLLAVSGSNVALVVLFLIVVLRPFGLTRRSRSVILLIGVGLFALLSYGEPSVVRASVMAGFVLLVQLLERRYDLNNIVALTALCILLYDPAQLFDVSFQLSFAAAWGLIFIVPRVHRCFPHYHGRLWYRYLVLPIIVATVAQICSAPLIALYFQRTPLISPVANLIIVPLVSVAVVGVLIMLVADLVLPLLGLFLGSLLTQLMELIAILLSWFGGDGTLVVNNAELSPLFAIAAYLFILSVAISLTNQRVRRTIVFSVLAGVNVILLVLSLGFARMSTVTTATFFNIPGGVATVIQGGQIPEADLFITGLGARDYDIGAKILLPDLRQLGVEKLRHLVVVATDHSAVDDLRRMCIELCPERILVHPAYYRSYVDWEKNQPLDIPAAELIGTAEQDSARVSVYADGESVVIRLSEKALVFQRRIKLEGIANGGINTTVIVAEPLFASDDDPVMMLGNGVRVVCSKIVQPEYDYEIPRRSVGVFCTESVVDLSRQGYFRIELADPS